MSEQSDWTKEIVLSALRRDRPAVQAEIDKFVEHLVESGVPLPEALTWASRLATILGTRVTLTPVQ